MGFFSWLRNLFFGKAEPPRPRDPDRPASRTQDTTSQKTTQIRAGETPASAVASQPRPAQPAPRTIDLSADDFLPISRADLKKQAGTVERWGPWFGRRDLIPPADDPRTKLIDRGMVTNGVLSPEQLVEIHKVGDEMEQARPSLARVEQELHQAGEAGVAAERERKKKLKEEKKAAAAERKKQHAEAVARRKATDIIYLGRGVSGRLGDRTADAAKLQTAGLPVLAAPAELAAALGISVSRLRWLAFHAEVASRVHYVHFSVPKKAGGTRLLSAPHRSLAAAQRWVFENIVNKLPAEPPAHGFLPGRGIVSNAREHVKKDVVVNLDLEGFFPNITFPRVRSVFHRLGYSPAVATILALLSTECPRRTVQYDGKTYHVAVGPRGLPQGACTSPGLSNQVARRLDKRLAGLAKKLGIAYTRYADDLTFSGPKELTAFGEKGKNWVGWLMAKVRHIAEDEGFVVNEKKSRVLRRNAAQKVTGLVVNDQPSVPRQEIRRLRAILHRARHEGLDAQNRQKLPHFRAWLEGKIAFVSMVRPEIGARLREELKKLG